MTNKGTSDSFIISTVADICENIKDDEKSTTINLNSKSLNISSGNGLMETYLDCFIFLVGRVYNERNLTDGNIPIRKVIAQLYRKKGLNFITRLKGIFSIVIIDKLKNQIVLIRDPIGIETLFYYFKNGTVIISNNIKKIARLIPRKVNKKILPEFFVFRTIVGEDTFFKDIKSVLPGEMIIFKDNNMDREKYWKPTINVSNNIHPNEKHLISDIEKNLKNILNMMTDNVQGYKLSNMLSGGVDSSYIQLLINDKVNGMQTYSISHEDRAYDESSYALDVSNIFNTNHTNFTITPNEFLENLEECISEYGQPLYLQQSVTYYVLNKKIRDQDKESKIILFSGQSADGIFGGYRIIHFLHCKKIYKLSRLLSLLNNMVIKHISYNKYLHYKNSINKAKVISTKEIEAFKEVDVVGDPFIVKEIFNLNDDGIIYQDRIKLIKEFEGRLVDRISLLHILTIVHSCSVWHALSKPFNISVEFPFPSPELIELMLRIPSEKKVKGNIEKYLLKKSLSKYLPSKIVYRRKKANYYPLYRWFEKEDSFKELINEIKEAPYRRYIDVQKIIELSSSKNQREYILMWNLINFHLWYKNFILKDVV